jgi:hypothetical protein
VGQFFIGERSPLVGQLFIGERAFTFSGLVRRRRLLALKEPFSTDWKEPRNDRKRYSYEVLSIE